MPLAQGTGGSLLFNASKATFNPGPEFGPYAVAKTATLALMRQYAIDLGKYGIRANAINADRIRTGLFGGGVLEWGSHCVDLCQWAVDDCPPPVDYAPPVNGEIVCRYANGTELVFREQGWIPLGSCPVRFEGETGWVEAGDSGKIVLSSPELMAGRKVAEIGGYPATFHVRDFLDCCRTRGKPKGNADAACNAHIACHATNIAMFLGRPVKLDTETWRFIDDDQANRLRSEALREPWRL